MEFQGTKVVQTKMPDANTLPVSMENPKVRENHSVHTPSAGLSAKQKSNVVKKARAGQDIGKKGKGFAAVVANAKKYGATNPRAVAAAAMWKNIKRTY